ncbi:MAG: NifU family protein [Solirubrobacteraceae bacterium]
MDDAEARDRVARIETLLEEVEALSDPVAQEKATEVVSALLDLYGEGLARMVAQVAERDDDGELAQALSDDDLVSHLLLLHGLHPVPLETRVGEALEGVRPYLESHGGNVELLGVEDGVVRLRMEGSCSGCPSSAVTLKLAIEDAIHKVAPDVVGIEAEGAVEEAPPPSLIELQMAGPAAQEPEALRMADPSAKEAAPSDGLIELQMAGAAAREPARAPATNGSWASAGGIPELSGGGPVVKDVAGEALLFVRLDGSVYAYRPQCPGCGESLGDAALNGAELSCPECGGRYDVRRAGRSLDGPERHLDPVPLLVDQGGQVKVAVGSLG